MIAFAHHEPSKIPKYKPLSEPVKAKSDEANQAKARGAFIALALMSGD